MTFLSLALALFVPALLEKSMSSEKSDRKKSNELVEKFLKRRQRQKKKEIFTNHKERNGVCQLEKILVENN